MKAFITTFAAPLCVVWQMFCHQYHYHNAWFHFPFHTLLTIVSLCVCYGTYMLVIRFHQQVSVTNLTGSNWIIHTISVKKIWKTVREMCQYIQHFETSLRRKYLKVVPKYLPMWSIRSIYIIICVVSWVNVYCLCDNIDCITRYTHLGHWIIRLCYLLVLGGSILQRFVTKRANNVLWYFFSLILNVLMNGQSIRWWSETRWC